MSIGDNLARLRAAGLHAVEDTEGLLILETPVGSSLIFDLSDPLYANVRDASALILTLSAVEQQEFISAVPRAFEHSIAVMEAQLHESAISLEAAQQLNNELRQELTRYVESFRAAEQVAFHRQAEVETYASALKEAQDLALDRQAELEDYAKALKEAQDLALERQTELEGYATALKEAQDVAYRLNQNLETARDQQELANGEIDTRREEVAKVTARLCESRLQTELTNLNVEKLRCELLKLRAREISMSHS